MSRLLLKMYDHNFDTALLQTVLCKEETLHTFQQNVKKVSFLYACYGITIGTIPQLPQAITAVLS
jgi:hypothetical protein